MALLVPVFYNSCEKKNQTQSTKTSDSVVPSFSCEIPGSSSKVVLAKASDAVEFPLSFKDKKIQLDNKSSATLQLKAESTEYLVGAKMVGLLNMKCLDLKGLSEDFKRMFLPVLISDQETTNIAIEFEISENIEKDIFQQIASSEECLLGMSWPKSYTLQSAWNGEYNDENFKSQSAYFNTIDAGRAHGLFYSSGVDGSSEVYSTIVAVVDTGVDYLHPDLIGNIWSDSNGYGVNVIANVGSSDHYQPIDRSSNSHGTHISGIIAASTNNHIGVAGLAPSGIKIMPVKVFDDNETSSNIVYNGILWAVDHGADVINLSLSRVENSDTNDPIYISAIEYALEHGVVVTAVTANSSFGETPKEIDNTHFTVIPGRYGAIYQGLITVASINASDYHLSSFSHYSSTFAEIAAPGTIDSSANGILSTIRTSSGQAKYGQLHGTSMAGPMVAAAAALAIRSFKLKGKSFTPALIENLILSSSKKISGLECVIQKGRVLDMYALAKQVVQQTE